MTTVKITLNKSSNSIKKLLQITAVVTALIPIYLIINYYPPLEIQLQEENIWGLACRHAEDLVVQEYDAEGNIWATRGMWAYRLLKNDSTFVRQYHVPTGFSIYWLRNFSIARRITNIEACVELLPLPNGGATVMSAGHMWYRTSGDVRFKKTFTLRHYGIGVGRGVHANSINRMANGSVVFGEYFRNSGQNDVRIFISHDGGKTWDIAHEFPPGRIRHVHVIKQDPYTGDIWIGTGDKSSASMIARTSDNFEQLEMIGANSQVWRTLTFIFTEHAVIWGTDTENAEYAGIYKWDRSTGTISKIAGIAHCIFYATQLPDGSIVLSTDREGTNNEEDDKTRLLIMRDRQTIHQIECGTWVGGNRHATLRFPRNTRGNELILTCLNQKKYNNDLIMISEQVLMASGGLLNQN